MASGFAYEKMARGRAKRLWLHQKKHGKILATDYRKICGLGKVTSIKDSLASFARVGIEIPDIWDLVDTKYKRYSGLLMDAAAKKPDGKLTYKEMMLIFGIETISGSRYKYGETAKRGFPVPEIQLEKKYIPREKFIKQEPVKKYDSAFWYPGGFDVLAPRPYGEDQFIAVIR